MTESHKDTICDVCATSTRVPGYGEQFGTLQALWGYGAGHDGERYRVNLCESCFFAALAFLKQERRTQNLFSDEQPCEEGFYPVSTDGLKRAENFRSCLATLRRIRGL
ncbi:hypothetical protein [Stutzerimonas chloritidismutans]|uniref:Uncharacterized protein n=2 Tax=Pseudomonadaceae TaxID=135621 RepID=A0ABU9M6W8_STUCH